MEHAIQAEYMTVLVDTLVYMSIKRKKFSSSLQIKNYIFQYN
jgi:hypothetical protein